MSEMVERAAKRVYEERAALPPKDPALWADATEEAREWLRGHIRAALLAALDPEDEDLTGLAYGAAENALIQARPVGRAIIEALRKAISQGEQ